MGPKTYEREMNDLMDEGIGGRWDLRLQSPGFVLVWQAFQRLAARQPLVGPFEISNLRSQIIPATSSLISPT
jgi:hypothetical protein